MFSLDLFRFCESRKNFSRQDLCGYIFQHRECERFARHAGITPKQFAALAGREFSGRMMTEGYLDQVAGQMFVRNKMRRPPGLDLESLNAKESEYIRLMANIHKMTDEEIFGGLE